MKNIYQPFTNLHEARSIYSRVPGETKIAIVTAIFGGKDTPKPLIRQSTPCDHFCFTEENTPVPLPNLPDRLKAKYFKLQIQKVLPEYDAFVWIDGNIEVKSPDFAKTMLDAAGTGIAIQRHHERQTIGEEIDFILSSKNPYLTSRYGRQPLREEYEYYLSAGLSPNAPLYACNLFAFHSSLMLRSLFDSWWRLVLEWSWFDQSAFSYVLHLQNRAASVVRGAVNCGASPVDLGPMFSNPYFTLHPHAKPLE